MKHTVRAVAQVNTYGGRRRRAGAGDFEKARQRQAIPASDSTAVARASHEFLRKYQPSPHAQEMVQSEVLPTTLRLEPR